MEEASEIPLCLSCNHRHIQGIKCQICGHVGRSQIYQKMRARADILRSFKIESFDASTSESNVRWDICYELRRMINCEELSIPKSVEFDSYDQLCRHIVGWIGDVPLSVARWRLSCLDNNIGIVIIDRLAIHEMYRRQGYGKKTLEYVIKDIHEIAQLKSFTIKSIMLEISDENWIVSKLLQNGLQVDLTCGINVKGGKNYLILRWNS